VEQLFVASSGSDMPEGRKTPRSVGLRHAYLVGQEQTLCGLTLRYLHAIENTKWSGTTRQRCSACEKASEKAAPKKRPAA
jgi:hypothetical protein